MKKKVLLPISIIVGLLIIAISIPTFAVETPAIAVHSDKDLIAEAGGDISIPVYMEDNPGLMGYVLQFDYDADLLTPVSVMQGTAIKEGIFNDDIGGTNAVPGTLKVMWNHSAGIKENGLVFHILFHVSDTAAGECRIHISNDTEDTYGGSLENIKMECEDVSIQIQGDDLPITKIESKAAGCVTEGNREYYIATKDGTEKYYSDAEAKNEIEKNSWIIPAAGHKWDEGTVTTPATCTQNGSTTYTCSICGETKTEEIPKVDHVYSRWRMKKNPTVSQEGILERVCDVCGNTESTTVDQLERISIKSGVVTGIKNKTYTGNVIKPKITLIVDDIELRQGTDYTLSYANNKVVGTATITITGKGNYKDSIKKTFKITKAANPVKIKVSAKPYKQSALKKPASFSIGTSQAQGKVTYILDKKAKAAKISVTAKGKVTVPKKCKKGTYTITVKAAGNKNYKGRSKIVTIKVT